MRSGPNRRSDAAPEGAGPEGATPGPAARPDPMGRRSVISSGAAAGLGIAVLVLPSARAAASGDGLLAPAGTFTTPTGFSGAAGDTTVDLSWTPVVNAEGYQVQYRVGSSGAFSSFVAVPGGTTEGVTVSGLANGTTYEFQVVAYQGASVSAPAGPVSLTPALSAPGTPANLTAAPAESGELVVAWEVPESGGAPALYRVQYAASGSGSWVDGGTTAATTLTLTGLTNDSALDVRVRAENDAGDSAYTDSVTATPLASTATAVANPEPRPPVVGVVTQPTSLVVVTDRLEAANAGYVYSWKATGAGDETYETVTFADADATFTIDVGTPVPASGGYTVRKVKDADTAISTFTFVSVVTLYDAGALYRLDNPASGDTYVGGVLATVRGGGGGRGGSDGGTFQTTRSGGLPSAPGEVLATIPFGLGEQLRISAGGRGAAGASDRSGQSGGGVGGTNVLSAYNGGRGGHAGTSGDSGAGGGGGAASVILRGTSFANSTPVIVAGGSGGGGGGNVSTDRNGATALTTPGGRVGLTEGAVGAQSSGDAAGAGGGGGGAEGGLGGSLESYGGKWRTTYLTAARPGTNLVAAGVTATIDGLSSTVVRESPGQITLTYLEVTDISSVV